MNQPWLFVLKRIEDVSGVSGTGIVADGVDFGEFVVICWRKRPPQNISSVVVYRSMEEVERIHGEEVWSWRPKRS